MAFSLHAYYCAEHVGEFASRVREMRQPPYGLEVIPNASLDLLFRRDTGAPGTEALLLGLYERAMPALIRGTRNLMSDTNKLFDHPTCRLCRLTLVELARRAALRQRSGGLPRQAGDARGTPALA